MSSYAVIGLGYGDEAKGLTVNSLCHQFPEALVVRYSGGQQAGHTVVKDGKSHVFSNFGAGTLNGNHTYWSSYCTFDPVAVLNELKVLKELGIDPVLLVDRNCPVTTPFEKYRNQKNDSNLSHGTCGAGVGATYAREEAFYSLFVGDLEYEFVLDQKMQLIERFYNFDVMLELAKFFEACEAVQSYIRIVDGLPNYREIVYEGSQGLLLDQHIGFFPHVTRSNVGSKNVLALNSKYGSDLTYMLITRAFQTRHGNGPMTNSNIPNNILDNPLETNILNKYQGQFRKSLLDLSLLKYGMNRDEGLKGSSRKNSKQLVLTCLDLVKNEYRYTIDGKIVGHSDEDSFVEGIRSYLDIDIVHRVRSPDALFNVKI